ncbi:MAG: multiprotein bridging factor aMBF1 [Methanobacteriota archaeon]
MICEMCGKEVPSTRRTLIEGTSMDVCGSCAKFGVDAVGHGAEVTGRSRIVESLARRETRQRPRDVYSEAGEQVLAEDYGERVRHARERRKLSLEEVGKAINEKESFLHKVEAQHVIPPDPLVKKLEKFFEIKLRESPAFAPVGAKPTDRKAVTLGDLLKDRLEKP